MRSLVIAMWLLLMASAGEAIAQSFPHCILDKMPGSANVAHTGAVLRQCRQAYPQGYGGVLAGAGRGIFSFDSGDACILSKGRNTTNQQAGFMIQVACNCLYRKPAYPSEPCIQNP